MSDVTAAAGEEHVPQRTFDLPSVLLVIGTEAFVAALIIVSGELSPAWLLFLIPITIGALAYGVAGAIITWAVSVGMLVLASPDTAIGDQLPLLVTGFAVFVAGGIVAGVQAHRLRVHAAALEVRSPLDGLTGTYKAGPLTEKLAAEVARAERYGHAAGLVVLRVEGFEEFARTFGRYKADAMLEHLSAVIRLAVRSTDTVGRIDTTGFAVIVPHATAGQSAGVAERLGRVVAATEFEGDALEPVTRCAITCASASYPIDAASPIALLDTARDRLGGPNGLRGDMPDTVGGTR